MAKTSLHTHTLSRVYLALARLSCYCTFWLCMYNGNKLTHFYYFKIDNKISVWGWSDMGTTIWPYHPMESARCFFLWDAQICYAGFRKAGLKDSNARHVQWQIKTVYFSNNGTGAYNIDDENVFECEGSWVSRLLGTELRAPTFFSEQLELGPGSD